MKRYLKLMAAASEAREALNRYMSETPPDQVDRAKVTELQGKLNDAEKEFRTAVESAETEDEPTETRTLAQRIELRNYMTAALRGEKVEGAEAEFNKEVGLSDLNTIPWEALEDRDDKPTIPAAAAIANPMQSILGRVFRRARASFLGVRMPSVASGEPVYPVITGSQRAVAGDQGSVTDAVQAKAFAPGGAVEAGEMQFTGVMVSPKRLSARYLFRIEDAAKFAGLEDTLRSDLRNVMSDLLDQQVLNGSGTGASFNGLFRNAAAGPLGAFPATLADSENFNISTNDLNAINEALDSYLEYVDGFWAEDVSSIRTLIGTQTFRRFGHVVLAETGASLGSFLRRDSMTYAAWGGTPAPAKVENKNTQHAVQTRNGSDMVVPIWQGVSIIRDQYSGAASGEVAITAHMLANSQLLRTDNWRGISYQLEA